MKKMRIVLFLIVTGVLCGIIIFSPINTTSHLKTTAEGESQESSLLNSDSFSYAECDCEDPDNDESTSSGSCTIITDKRAYLPTENVTVFGYGFEPLSFVNLTIERPCSCGEHDLHIDAFDLLPTDNDGRFEMDYQHYGTIGLYNVTCTDGLETAESSFIMTTCVIWTDKPKYLADETVTISGTGFNMETEVNITVINPDNSTVQWTVMTDGSGNFTTTTVAAGIDGMYGVIATDIDNIAATSFLDPLYSNAWLQVTPHFGYVGLPASASGWGFEGDGIIYILGKTENLILATFTAENGHFDTEFIVPDIPPDYYMICASSSVYIEQTLCIPGVCIECHDVCLLSLFGACLWWGEVCVPEYCNWCYDAGYYEYFEDCIDFPFAIYPSPIVDETPPTTTVELEGTQGCGDWFTSEVLFNLSASDEITDVEKTSYRVGETGPWIEYTEEILIEAEGIIDIYYNSTDVAGNVEETQHVRIMIDWTKPETTAAAYGTMGLSGW
ncbi:MAG: hypothetical protein RTU63_08525, partial [Candidatus Thorarchaeota archaeon]